MSLLASVINAAQDVNVRIIDDGRGGLSWRDFVIPLGALVAGIGGVLIGGLIQTRIEKKRGEREDRLDDRRAQRERDLEDERQRKADNALKRQAIGSIRVQAFTGCRGGEQESFVVQGILRAWAVSGQRGSMRPGARRSWRRCLRRGRVLSR